MKKGLLWVTLVLILGLFLGCEGKTGPAGSAGATGEQGPQGTAGTPYTPPTLAAAPTITLSYNAAANITNVVSALNTLGYTWTDSGTVKPSGGAQVIINSQDGGPTPDPLPDWSAHLNAGRHVLLMGGTSEPTYCTSIGQYFTTDGTCTWHMTNACTSDWISFGTSHPILKYLPATYEFGNQSATYNVTHFAASTTQLTGTTMIGFNCEPNYIAVVREYPSGGTITFILLDIGRGAYTTANDVTMFVTPLIKGYLEWLRMR